MSLARRQKPKKTTRCVLVVDDDPAVVDWLIEALDLHGIVVEGVTDPLEALEMASEQAFDVIISDMEMPSMGGSEFIRAIRAHRSDQPVVAMSAFGTADLAARCQGAEASDFLAKPFRAEALVQAIERSLSNNQARPDSKADSKNNRSRAVLAARRGSRYLVQQQGMNILVVEDATKLARFISRVLSEEGYVVDLCADGLQAIDQARASKYALIVLDWMLPGTDGLTVLRELRLSGSTVPILMLTARGETSERVLALDSGADDFLVKPFEVEELVARVRALLRRSTGFGELHYGPLCIDRNSREVKVGSKPIRLTGQEYALLLHFVHRADKVVKRSELLEQVWNSSFEPGSNVVEVHVSRLRDKLGEHAWMIETVRGVGYRLRSRPSP